MENLDIHTELVQYGGPYLQRLRAMCFVETKLRLSYLCVDRDIQNHFAVKLCHPQWESPK